MLLSRAAAGHWIKSGHVFDQHFPGTFRSHTFFFCCLMFVCIVRRATVQHWSKTAAMFANDNNYSGHPEQRSPPRAIKGIKNSRPCVVRPAIDDWTLSVVEALARVRFCDPSGRGDLAGWWRMGWGRWTHTSWIFHLFFFFLVFCFSSDSLTKLCVRIVSNFCTTLPGLWSNIEQA